MTWPDRLVPFLANEQTTQTAQTEAHGKPQDNIYLHICTVRPAHQNVLSFPQSWGGRRCRRHRRGRCLRTYFDPHGCVVSNRRMRDRKSVCASGPTAAIGALDAAASLAAVLTTPPLPMFAGARSKPAAATAAAVTAPSLVVPAPLCTNSFHGTADVANLAGRRRRRHGHCRSHNRAWVPVQVRLVAARQVGRCGSGRRHHRVLVTAVDDAAVVVVIAAVDAAVVVRTAAEDAAVVVAAHLAAKATPKDTDNRRPAITKRAAAAIAAVLISAHILPEMPLADA